MLITCAIEASTALFLNFIQLLGELMSRASSIGIRLSPIQFDTEMASSALPTAVLAVDIATFHLIVCGRVISIWRGRRRFLTSDHHHLLLEHSAVFVVRITIVAYIAFTAISASIILAFTIAPPFLLLLSSRRDSVR